MNNKLIFISRLDREAKEFQSRKKKNVQKSFEKKICKKSFQKRIWHKKEFPEVKFAKEPFRSIFCKRGSQKKILPNG